MGMDLLMPKYKVTLSQYKFKVIRASSLAVAEERAEKMETDKWGVTEIKEVIEG
jgi:hypothetical protein